MPTWARDPTEIPPLGKDQLQVRCGFVVGGVVGGVVGSVPEAVFVSVVRPSVTFVPLADD